jgi:hypothetical protein
MKKALSILLITPALLCKAQTGARTLNFNKGDEFEKKTFIISSCQLQQGAQVMNIVSTSAVNTLYKVNNAAGGNFSLTITTNTIVDTINAVNRQMVYHSNVAADTSSVIQTTLNNIVAHPVTINVNANGIISSANSTAMPNSNTILAYAGIQTPQYNKGDELDLAAGFTASPLYTKGFSWTDSAEKNGVKTITTYTIVSTQDSLTTISFKGTVAESYFNTNITGALMIDNATGVIVQKAAQTASTGYNTLNGITYTEIRRTTLAEYCLKKQ